MRRVGEVSGTAQGLVIVRCHGPDPPSIGTAVVDERLERVGRVVDVFGPVPRPYLAISPGPDITPSTILGKRLYARNGHSGNGTPKGR